MGLISIGRAIKRPLQNIARGMNAECARVSSLFSRPGPAPVEPEWFPGESLETDPLVGSNYPCDIVNQAPDQFRVLNPNPVTITTSPIQLALENRNRARVLIENCGTSVVYIGLGYVPTSLIYTKALGACTANDDATGGFFVDNEWQGVIWAVTGGGSSKLQFTENNKT